MKTQTKTFRFRIAAGIACLAALAFTTAHAARTEVQPSSDELAVWQATAKVVARDYMSTPYKVWYFQSDFTSASFITTACRRRPSSVSEDLSETGCTVSVTRYSPGAAVVSRPAPAEQCQVISSFETP